MSEMGKSNHSACSDSSVPLDHHRRPAAISNKRTRLQAASSTRSSSSIPIDRPTAMVHSKCCLCDCRNNSIGGPLRQAAPGPIECSLPRSDDAVIACIITTAPSSHPPLLNSIPPIPRPRRNAGTGGGDGAARAGRVDAAAVPVLRGAVPQPGVDGDGQGDEHRGHGRGGDPPRVQRHRGAVHVWAWWCWLVVWSCRGHGRGRIAAGHRLVGFSSPFALVSPHQTNHNTTQPHRA